MSHVSISQGVTVVLRDIYLPKGERKSTADAGFTFIIACVLHFCGEIIYLFTYTPFVLLTLYRGILQCWTWILVTFTEFRLEFNAPRTIYSARIPDDDYKDHRLDREAHLLASILGILVYVLFLIP